MHSNLLANFRSVENFYTCLGSNLGNRAGYLKAAIVQLSKLGKISNVSRIYETTPWETATLQENYLNQVVILQTKISPLELKIEIDQIESNLGRVRKNPNDPRNIDIDIIFWSGGIFENIKSKFFIPHPRMHERAFVLLPLSEVARDYFHPKLKKSVAELLLEIDTGLAWLWKAD